MAEKQEPRNSPDEQNTENNLESGVISKTYSPGTVGSAPPSEGDQMQSSLGIKEGLAQLVFMAFIFFMMSFWLHFPGMQPNVYSDLMDTLWQRILNAPGIIPYVNYNLEYPAISAIVLYVSSVWRNMYAFYFSMCAIIFACMLGSLYVVYRTLKERGIPIRRISYFMIFTPVFIYYSIYSFDWIGAVFMVGAIYFCYRHRAPLSGISMGFAVAARIIPIVCLPFLFFEFKSRKDRVLLLASTGGAWLAVNIYFILTNFSGFLYAYTFQEGFYAEDSWLNILSPYDKTASAVLLLASLLLILYKRKHFNIFQQSLLAMVAFVVFNYKFPPQYMIMLLPLFALTGESYTEFMFANILDVMLILWYFTPLFNFGNAIATSSPVQWIAYLRQYALFLVFAKMMVSTWRRGRKGIIGQEGSAAQVPGIPSQPPVVVAAAPAATSDPPDSR